MKRNKFKIAGIGITVGIIALLAVACTKSSAPDQNRSLTVHLTDDPAVFSNFFIDIKYVEVKIDQDLNHDSHFADNDKDGDNDKKDHDQYGKWDTLVFKPGVYDILKLKNGLDIELAKGNIAAGRIGKIRLTLGTNNTVVVGGVTKPLVLATGTNNYVYVKVEDDDLDETPGGQVALWIDFDIAASVEESNGIYYLKSHLKAFGMEKFGKIEGKVLPLDAHTIVKASMGSDVSNAIPDEGSGEFKIRGLKEGSYTISYKGYNGYMDTTLTNIQVVKGKETHLPSITLHK